MCLYRAFLVLDTDLSSAHLYNTLWNIVTFIIPLPQIGKFAYKDVAHIAHKWHESDLCLDSIVLEFMVFPF